MAKKTLEDFKKSNGEYGYQAYADYLESADCANDEYDIYADEKGNVYEPLDGDWNNGHTHYNVNSNWPGRNANDPDSKNRPWKNRWLKYIQNLSLKKLNF